VTGKPAARILIVEDTAEFAQLVRVALDRLPAQVCHAANASDALDTIADDPPDLILLDIGLPDMDGWRLLEALRLRPEVDGREPVVIVLTAYNDPANRLMGKLQGVDGYLVKSCTMASIRSSVAAALCLDADPLDTLNDPRG